MLTYDDALKAREFWHMSKRNADGTPVRARRNGATQVWKKPPRAGHDFRIPAKYGLKQCFNITDVNAADWCTPEKWPVEHVLFAELDTTVLSTREQQLALAIKAFELDPTPALAATIQQLRTGHA